MGRVVDFAKLAAKPGEDGIARTPVTMGDTKEFTAEIVRVPAGKSWRDAVPAGCDGYVFVLKGKGSIDAASYRQELVPQTFATLGEGVGFWVAAGQEALELISVTTPTKGAARKLAGFAAALDVKERAREPVVSIPAEHKQRIYFCGDHHGAQTERGHAMIVVYDGDTNTPLHHHPNAESMFVLLDGACRFTVNGEQVVVGPGQAAYFTVNDKHGLHTAPGHKGASFLEFHIPAAFSTVKA